MKKWIMTSNGVGLDEGWNSGDIVLDYFKLESSKTGNT